MAKAWVSPILVVLGLMLVPHGSPIAQAQATCPHATLRLESSQPVDQAAVCEAARVWADQGYGVLVFLTDTRPNSEDDWFDLLDQVEAAAGLRDLSQGDYFESRAIALGITTATDLPYAVIFTYGEALFSTPLDTDPVALDSIKRRVRGLMAAQDPTGALGVGLEETADLADIGSPSAAATAPPVGSLAPADANGGGAGAVGWLGGGLAVIGGGGALALRRRRRQRLEAQLEVLQARIPNLLMGCEQLLTGPAPEDMVPYQLFVEAGGDNYPDLTQQVQSQLRQGRQALDQAFQVHAALQEDAAQLQQPLAKRVEAWELLYLSFVGKRDRIQAMSDEELQTLLNPALVLGNTQGLSAGLINQLEAIQQKVQGTPLKVQIIQANASSVDQEGILGLVEQVDNTISRLREAMIKAPEQLAATRQRRQALAVTVPPRLGLSPEQVLAGIDTLLANADQALHQQQLYLRTLECCDQAEAAMAIVATLGPEFEVHDQRVEEMAAIATQGYRPPLLDQHQQEMDEVLGLVQQVLRQGRYDQVPEALRTLKLNTYKAHTAAIQWQELHQQNVAAIQGLIETGDRLQRLDQEEVASAWTGLRQYSPDNWEDLTATHTAAQSLLHEIRTQDVFQLQQNNSLAVQALYKVKDGIAAPAKRLETVEAQLRQVLDRWQLLQRAEANLHRELGEIETYIGQTTNFAHPKLLGLVQLKQPDGRLQSAQEEVNAARNHFQGGSVLRACAARDQALRWVLLVYIEKVQEQVATVRPLAMNSDASQQGRSEFQTAIALIPDSVGVGQATEQALFQHYANVGQARQHLQTAESLCRRAINAAEDARRRRNARSTYHATGSFGSSSSRSSSSWSSSSSRRSSSSGGSSSRRSSSSGGGSSRRSSGGGSSRRR